MLKKTIIEGSKEFDLFNSDSIIDLLVVSLCLVSLISTFIYGIFNKYILDKKLMYA